MRGHLESKCCETLCFSVSVNSQKSRLAVVGADTLSSKTGGGLLPIQLRNQWNCRSLYTFVKEGKVSKGGKNCVPSQSLTYIFQYCQNVGESQEWGASREC